MTVRVLVVDGANVVGSRPDGWWRDRPGAAERLWRRLAAADLAYDEVVLVLEGAARTGVPAGVDAGVQTVHAAGSGDDTIVDVARRRGSAGHEVTVVTADRGLSTRLREVGAGTTGPSWLLGQLDAPEGPRRSP